MQVGGEARAEEQVVAQDQGGGAAVQEALADEKGVGQPPRLACSA